MTQSRDFENPGAYAIPYQPQSTTMMQHDVPLGRVVAASFRQENTVVNAIRGFSNMLAASGDVYDENYDLRAKMHEEGNKKYMLHLSSFLGVGSDVGFSRIAQQIDQEEEDRKARDQGGAAAFVSGIFAGALDPFLIAPVGGAVRTIKGGLAIGRSALMTGVAGGAVMAGQEAILQSAQLTRTLEESFINVASGTVLAGILGAGAAGLLNRSEAREMAGKLERLNEITSSPTYAQAAGAAAVDERTLVPVSYGLDKVPVVNKMAERLSPTLNAAHSESVAFKRAFFDIFETALRFTDNLSGVTTAKNGIALSRQAQMIQYRGILATEDILEEAYGGLRLNEGKGSVMLAQAGDALGRTPEGKLSFTDLKREVTRALFSGDVHAVPEVQKAAQEIRKTVLEPLQKALVDVGLLSPDAKPLNDPSYFARMWNRQEIVLRRDEFKQKGFDWLTQEQSVKYEAQQRIAALHTDIDQLSSTISKLESRLETIGRKDVQLNARMSERAMEVRRTDARVGSLQERSGLIADRTSDLEEFLVAMREEVKDPTILERLSELEADVKDLARQDVRSQLTEADLARIERVEAEGILADDVVRTAADMVLGKRQPVKEPSFAHWMAKEGGVLDTGGDLRAALGGKNVVPGMLSRGDRSLSLDQWGEKIMDRYNLPSRPDPDQVVRWVEDSLRGRQPEFWLDSFSGKMRKDIEASRMSAIWDEALDNAGFSPKSREDMAAFLRGESREGVKLEDLDRALADMEAVGEVIPVSMRAEGAEGALAVAREEVAQVRTVIAAAMKRREGLRGRARAARVREGEAGVAARENVGRMGILEDQAGLNATKRELVEEAHRIAADAQEAARVKLEEEISAWRGKSTSEAVSAIRAREKASVGRAADAPRLRVADEPIMRAARKIIDSNRQLSAEELSGRMDEIIDRILGGPTGRLPYDEPSGAGGAIMPTDDIRGSLHHREFAIPTEAVFDFVQQDVSDVIRSLHRSLVPDLLLKQHFGEVDLKNVKKAIQTDYARMMNEATDGKQREALRQRHIRDIENLDKNLEVFRGMAGMANNSRYAGRVSAFAKNLGTVVHLGGAALTSITDMAGPVFRYGLENTFKDAWAPFVGGLIGVSKVPKEVRKQARAALIAIDTETGLRANNLGNLAERPSGTGFERGMHYAAQYSQIINLLGPETDLAKRMAYSVASSESLRAIERVVGGTATKRDITALAESGINSHMAGRIWQSNIAEGGHNMIDGHMIANSGAWADRQAAMVFDGAMGREVDIAVITPGYERQFWIRGPIGGVIGQFKSFVMGANERMLIAGLQRRDINTLQGALTGIAIGMLSYRLYTWSTGQEASDNPAVWLKEGVDRLGTLGIFGEFNNTASKWTRGRADIFRLIGANEMASRFQSRTALATLLGPTAGRLDKLAGAIGDISAGEATASTTRALTMQLPLQNLIGFRLLLDETREGFNNAMGIPDRRR